VSQVTPALLTVGLNASVRAVVSESDTATGQGSGDVPVLGTPRLLALAEAAAVAAVASQLADGETTVGTSVMLEHRRPSPVGSGLTVEAELTEVDGGRLVFSFIAFREEAPGQPGESDEHVLGAGTLERVVVRRDRFLARANHPPVPPAAPA
jgi:fluoroacetyl-CoA thioesterase